jgi:hypothetical protein
MIKLKDWDYVKLLLVLTILMSCTLMSKFGEYGSKGEYTLTEHGAESEKYVKKDNCDPDCAKACQKNNIDIIACLDACACNSVKEINLIPTSNNYFWITLAICVVLGLIIKQNMQQANEIYRYILSRLNLTNEKKDLCIIDNEEDENEYSMLNDNC